MSVESANCVNVVGVQFRRAGRIYDFNAGEFELRIGDDVVVETDRGPSIGKVRQLKFLPIDPQKAAEMKTILRRARRKDLEANSLTPEKALEISRSRVYELKLDMMVLQADVQFGGNKVILYFTAPGRIDFRDLVKDLASSLRSRVELKQVGARDETKILGGIGVCGREYCCSSFLREFVPVSIKMAKNQNLALNPSKVSGGCGRLLCCLTYENDMYTELRTKLPPRGSRLRAIEEDFVGNVIKADLLNQTVVLESESGQQLTVAIADTEMLDSRGGPPPPAPQGESEAENWAEDIDLSQLVDDEKQ
jgi:cell fate regulator YaaT (PSP1 superfamily)